VPTLSVTRPPAGTGMVSPGTLTAAPPSLVAGNANCAEAPVRPGFWSVRYSTKPGRIVPSAKLNVVDNAGAPTMSVPPSTTVPRAGSAAKYMGRSATIGDGDVTRTETFSGALMPCAAT